MQTQEFKISITAPREKVWKVLWDDKSYRAWTSVFSEGSHVETDWKKGSKVLFVDDKGAGMVSAIRENIPNEFMSFEHLGMVKDGVEDTTSQEIKEWSGAMENYRLTNNGNNTELVVHVDVADKWKDYFVKTFPLALEKVKELAEKN
jgi:hypothetical protein